MDLEGDLEAAESERDELQNQHARLEALAARAIEVAQEARGSAEAAALSAVDPLQKNLDKLAARVPEHGALTELRADIARFETRLSTLGERPRGTGHLVERLDEIEQAVITLARRTNRLRKDLDGFAAAINASLD